MNRFQAGLRGYHVVVNGTVLAAPRPGQLQLGVLSTYDLTELLKPGRNVITVELLCRDQGASLLAPEGIVFCRDGTTIRLLAEGWRGGWNLPDGWDAPESDPSALPDAPAQRERLAGRIDNVTPRPYLGPIRVRPRQPRATEDDPIFDDTEPVLLDITLLNLRGQAPAPRLAVSVMDEESRRTVHDGALVLAPAGEFDLASSLDLGLLPQGAYRVRFVLTAGDEELDRRDFEIACVGRIPQRVVEGTHYEDGMDLKQVWTVDCTAEPTADGFIAATGAEPLLIKGKPNPKWREVETRVVDGPAGRYRELAENERMHHFAYRYAVERVYVPHLAVVEWPDDAARNIIVFIKEPGITVRTYSHGFQRSDTAISTKHDLQPYRPSNQLKKLHLLFWPNAGAGSIHVMNTGGGERPAAAARITMYEIVNDLPAVRITEPAPEELAGTGYGPRLIGPHTERGPSTMGSTYYAGPLGGFFFSYLGPKDHPEFYRNWFSTTANWIKAARFSGQNLYLMGHFMVTGTLYPSAMWRFGYDQNNYLCGDATRDYAALVLRMFEHNGMKMISNIEHLSFSASSGTRQPTPDEVRAGAEHCYVVSREGTLFPLHAARYATGKWTGSGKPRANGTVLWPALNHMHPEVLDRYLALLGELADRYGRYPAWKGVNLMVSRAMGPMDPAHLRSMSLMEGGYEDFTINRFQAETGLTVPVDPKAPDRFEQRYQWIMGHAREPWIAWRCAKYTEFFRALRDRIAGRRDDVKLYLIIGEPMLWKGSQEILDGRYEDTPFVLDVMRQFGFDLQALKQEPNTICTCCPYCMTMFEDGLKDKKAEDKVKVMDLSEIVAAALKQG